MDPYINSVVNIYTASPEYLCRVPLNHDRNPLDKNTVRIVENGNPGKIACFIMFGVVKESNLRVPKKVYTPNGVPLYTRGISINAYETMFKRLYKLCAHLNDDESDLYFPVGSEVTFISQRFREERKSTYNFNSDEEEDSRYRNRSTHLHRPCYTQDRLDPSKFNFEFCSSLKFNERGQFIISDCFD